MLKSGKPFVAKNTEKQGHIPNDIKTHSEHKARVIPEENKTHAEDDVVKLVPGKGVSDKDAPPADGGITLDSGSPKIVPPSHKTDNKFFS